MGIVSLCEIKHNEGPEHRLFHEKAAKTSVSAAIDVSVKQNKRHSSANKPKTPALRRLSNETLGKFSQPAYTIPKLFYPPLTGMSSTNAQIYRFCTVNFVEGNKFRPYAPLTRHSSRAKITNNCEWEGCPGGILSEVERENHIL